MRLMTTCAKERGFFGETKGEEYQSKMFDDVRVRNDIYQIVLQEHEFRVRYRDYYTAKSLGE